MFTFGSRNATDERDRESETNFTLVLVANNGITRIFTSSSSRLAAHVQKDRVRFDWVHSLQEICENHTRLRTTLTYTSLRPRKER